MMVVAVITLLAAAWLLRARHIRTLETESQGRRAFDADGVVVGAAGIDLPRDGAPAVLLLHGGGDTPQSLAELAEFLHARGFAVRVPLLPGHGVRVRTFMTVTADDLTRAAISEYDRLRAAHAVVYVAGLSMGGALAAQIAARHRDLPALVLLAPYLSMPRKIARAARLAWLWGPVVPLVRSSEGISVRDAEQRARSLAYGVFSARALSALREIARRGFDALPHIVSPTLVIQSREDNRISVSAAEQAFARIGASEKRLEWISGAAHVITVDFGRDRVFRHVAEWLEGHSAVTARAS